MPMKKPNGYDLTRQWFDFAFENCGKVTSSHTALYVFLIEINNRLGWVPQFQITSTECMAGMSCKSHNTYKKVFDELVEWGFVEIVVKSRNQYQCNIIALSKFDEALDKALDKALANHLTKHLTKHLTYSKTTNHKPQTTNIIEPKKFGSDSEDKKLESDPTPPHEEPTFQKTENLEKKKVAPKKKSEWPVVEMESAWSEHLTKIHSIGYYANASERGALSMIARQLLYQVNERHKRDNVVSTNTDHEKIMSAWKYVLGNFGKWSQFNQKLTKLTQINGQLSNILAECKSSAGGGAGSKVHQQHAQRTAEVADLLRARFGGQNTEYRPPSQDGQAHDHYDAHEVVE